MIIDPASRFSKYIPGVDPSASGACTPGMPGGGSDLAQSLGSDAAHVAAARWAVSGADYRKRADQALITLRASNELP